jgi:hypothetical protein
MSREGARCRAREQAQYLRNVLGTGNGASLFGYQLIALYGEASARAPAAAAEDTAARARRALPFLMLIELSRDDDAGAAGTGSAIPVATG